MDIGFGALIDKFEDAVGKRATRVLVIVIYVAVFGFCARAIYDNLIHPPLVFFRTPLWGTTLIEIGMMALSIGLGIALGVQTLAAVRKWKGVRDTQKLLHRVEAIHDQLTGEGKDGIATVQRLIDESKQASEQNKALLLRIMEVGARVMQREAATDEDREAIRWVFQEMRDDLENGDAADDNSVTKQIRRVLESDAEGQGS